MRIITGRAKGVRLNTLEGETTRPTSERVKEAVFSMLQFDLEGRRVLDLFAGSGQLGLEAVSRGAVHAVMVDRSKEAVRVISSNVAKTGLGGDTDVVCMDYEEYIRRHAGQKFDIIFLDPPYAQGLWASALSALLAAEMLKETSLIVCESDVADIFAKNRALEERFDVVKVSRYSRTVISVLTPASKKEG